MALSFFAVGIAALNASDRIRPRAWVRYAISPTYRIAALTWELNQGERRREELARRLAETSLLIGRAEDYRRENDALRARAGLAITVPYELIYARIAEKHPESWLKTVTLDVGNNAGVEVGMPVIGTEGLLGVVRTTTPDASRVELLTSERLRVAATHAPTGVAGVGAADAGGGYHIHYLPRTLEIRSGDMFVTSSHSTLFPPGLILGYVKDYRRPFDSALLEVELTPAEDVQRLESVFVVKWKPPASRHTF